MPDKSVRDMGKRERMHHSLAARTFHASLMSSIVLGLVALLVGLILYTVVLSQQYEKEAFNLARNADAIIARVVDVEPYTTEVLDIYHGLSKDERAQVGTDAYYRRFAHITEEEGYQQLLSILNDFKGSSSVNDIYLGYYDPETRALVYIADSDQTEGQVRPAGYWQKAKRKEVNRFWNWDGSGLLRYVARSERYGLLCTSGVPVYGRDGDICGFILADVTMGDVAAGMKRFVLLYSAVMVIITLLLAYSLTQRMKKALVEPINAISEAARSYVSDRSKGVDGGRHFSKLDIRTGDEVENLSLIMADMERDLAKYERDLSRVAAEKERINTELKLANRIQTAMLPHIFPAFPEREEFDVYASMTPAKEVGGDFYDFFLIDDDHLGLVIADVSGKGVPAALYMMVSKILLQKRQERRLSRPDPGAGQRTDLQQQSGGDVHHRMAGYPGSYHRVAYRGQRRTRIPGAASALRQIRTGQRPAWLCDRRHGRHALP